MDGIAEALRQVFDGHGVKVLEGGGQDILGAQVVLYPSAGTPIGHRYSPGTTRRAGTVRAVCVSNSALGACAIADTVIETVDHRDIAGLVTVSHVSAAARDNSDPTGWCWSVTVEMTHTPARK